MWDRKELKAKGKAAFKANYWKSVLAAILLCIASGAGSGSVISKRTSGTMSEMFQGMSTEQMMAVMMALIGAIAVAAIVSMILQIFLFNPLEVGCQHFFAENSKEPVELNKIGRGFKPNYGKVVATILVRDIFIALWSLIFIIPGIIKIYSYRLVPYIIAENPDMKATDAITLSRKMMDGNKWRAFVLDLSFIGWYLLSGITFGILAIFYTYPYVFASNAELYHALKNNMPSEQ